MILMVPSRSTHFGKVRIKYVPISRCSSKRGYLVLYIYRRNSLELRREYGRLSRPPSRIRVPFERYEANMYYPIGVRKEYEELLRGSNITGETLIKSY